MKAASPACPNCARLMLSLDVEPCEHGRPELKEYRCTPCGYLFTEVPSAERLLSPDRALVLNFEADSAPH